MWRSGRPTLYKEKNVWVYLYYRFLRRRPGACPQFLGGGQNPYARGEGHTGYPAYTLNKGGG